MTNKELLGVFDDFSERLLMVLADSDRAKRLVQDLVEENARLRLENRKLQELLEQPEPVQAGSKPSQQGKEYLESIYDEGFHICNSDYGSARGTTEECLYCLELLYRD